VFPSLSIGYETMFPGLSISEKMAGKQCSLGWLGNYDSKC
jgi:hypothetical protein